MRGDVKEGHGFGRERNMHIRPRTRGVVNSEILGEAEGIRLDELVDEGGGCGHSRGGGTVFWRRVFICASLRVVHGCLVS